VSSSNLSSVAQKAPINITIPKGAAIFFTVPGEEGRVDFTPYASLFLSRDATLNASDLPDFDFDTTVDFGALSVDENVIFMRNSERLDQRFGICALPHMIILSISFDGKALMVALILIRRSTPERIQYA
jgi:hypothetical protein